MADYDKVGLLTVRDGRMLLCRKRPKKRCTTRLLILPGGCRETGESSMDCLSREIREELGDVAMRSLAYVGVYSDRAAGSVSKIVWIELYRADLIGEPVASSEIGELVWFGAEDDRAQLAPSIANKILPDLLSRGLLPWTR